MKIIFLSTKRLYDRLHLRSQIVTSSFDLCQNTGLALARKVDSIIHLLRGERVIFDSDLAELYGVSVKHLNQQIKRNARRFPPDFLFQLSPAEYENLRSQIVTSSSGHGAAVICRLLLPNMALSWRPTF